MASVLIAATPVTLANAISPMSDVPATALWALSWVISLRPGLGAATASGVAAAFAIMVRPNLAPLAGIIVIVIAASAGAWAHRTKRVLTFAAATMVGPAMVLRSQGVLYGDPLMAGYGSVGELFSTERILTYLQSAAAAHYTSRPVIRLDYLDSTPLDSVVKDLWRRGYQPAFVIDEGMEGAAFRAWFSDSRYEALEWPARAEFWSNTRLLYLLKADRERYANDETYSVDLLGLPRPASSFSEPMSAHDSQSAPFPPIHESIAFRRMLEDKYRNDLNRAGAPTYTDVATSATWTQRYIRYRLHACSHAEALRRAPDQHLSTAR